MRETNNKLPLFCPNTPKKGRKRPLRRSLFKKLMKRKKIQMMGLSLHSSTLQLGIFKSSRILVWTTRKSTRSPTLKKWTFIRIWPSRRISFLSIMGKRVRIAYWYKICYTNNKILSLLTSSSLGSHLMLRSARRGEKKKGKKNRKAQLKSMDLELVDLPLLSTKRVDFFRKELKA